MRGGWQPPQNPPPEPPVPVAGFQTRRETASSGTSPPRFISCTEVMVKAAKRFWERRGKPLSDHPASVPGGGIALRERGSAPGSGDPGSWPGSAPPHAVAHQEVDGDGLGAVGALAPLELVLQPQQEGAGVPGGQRQEVDVGGQLLPQRRELRRGGGRG